MTSDLRASSGAEGGMRRAGMGSSSLPPPASGLRFAALALTLVAFLFGVGFGSRTGGGSDSYGYVSQADLWLQGRLHVAQPWVARFAWPNVDEIFAPLAYRPGTAPHTIVPTYPPGFPLLMAAFAAAGGGGARYLVVPLMGAAAVWLTWVLGRRVTGDGGGLMAAVLLAASPAFLFHVLQPMSDVPATTAWLAAAVLLIGRPSRPLLAGLAAAVAILVRPNLSPLALVLLAVRLVRVRLKTDSTPPGVARGIRLQPTAVRDAARFVLGALPGVVVYLAFNAALYGGPLNSGYGGFRELFSAADPGGTLLHYGRQLIDTQTPFVVLAALGCFVARDSRGETRAMRVLLAGTVLLVFVSYAFYVRFDEWTYLRYLLPAYPALLVLAVAGLRWILSGGRWVEGGMRRLPAVVMAVACLVVAALTWRTAVERGLFDIKAFESRYERAARSVARLTPPNAIVFAMQHSGTLRYYGARPTLRYDLVDREALERTVGELTSAGYHPYFVLEDWEVEAFRDRFGPASASGRLERSPVARLWPRPAVFLYDAQDAVTAQAPDATR